MLYSSHAWKWKLPLCFTCLSNHYLISFIFTTDLLKVVSSLCIFPCTPQTGTLPLSILLFSNCCHVDYRQSLLCQWTHVSIFLLFDLFVTFGNSDYLISFEILSWDTDFCRTYSAVHYLSVCWWAPISPTTPNVCVSWSFLALALSLLSLLSWIISFIFMAPVIIDMLTHTF